MKLIELKEIVDSLVTDNENDDVVIEIYNRDSIGGTPNVSLDKVQVGFDWDNGRIILSSDKRIAEVTEAIDIVESWLKRQRKNLNK